MCMYIGVLDDKVYFRGDNVPASYMPAYLEEILLSDPEGRLPIDVVEALRLMAISMRERTLSSMQSGRIIYADAHFI
jgi:hypothetical protein